MFSPYRAFKKPEILDESLHKDLKIKVPENFLFLKEVETVPVGFSEIIKLTMYYPLLIAKFEGVFFPFLIMGVNGKNLYINEEGKFKVPYNPKCVEIYPFFVVKNKETGEWMVVFDEVCAGKEDGERLYDELGNETEFFKKVKSSLTFLAKEYEKALNFCEELDKAGLLHSINLDISCKYGQVTLQNVYILNIEVFYKLKPEFLYYLNSEGYLPTIYAMYFSARNFKLFDLL